MIRRIVTLVTKPIDRGATGPAALARRLAQVSTKATGIYARQVVEPGPLSGLRLEQRRLDAAAALVRLWRHLSPEKEGAAGEAARSYRDALDGVQWVCGPRGLMAIETVLIYHGQSHLVAHLPPALTALADHFEEVQRRQSSLLPQ